MTLTSLVDDIRHNHARDSSQQTWRTAAVSGGVDFNIWGEIAIQAKHEGGGIVIVIFWKAELQIWLRGHRKTMI